MKEYLHGAAFIILFFVLSMAIGYNETTANHRFELGRTDEGKVPKYRDQPAHIVNIWPDRYQIYDEKTHRIMTFNGRLDPAAKVGDKGVLSYTTGIHIWAAFTRTQ